MKALFVAWQDIHTRRWTPVGRLSRENNTYRFVYTRGAETVSGFQAFGRMSDIRKAYSSNELFPMFANRILARNRPEYADYLQWIGLASSDYDELEELSRTGGLRATDPIELFPCPSETPEGNYEVHFFTRGLRHLPPENETCTANLQAGERLYLMRDVQNAYDAMALLLRTGDPITLVGYAPRYYSNEFTQLMELGGAGNVKVTVERVNGDAPIQYRVLCRLVAPWPESFVPCGGGEFTPLA